MRRHWHYRLTLSCVFLLLACGAYAEETAVEDTTQSMTLRNFAGEMLQYRFQGVPFKPYADVLKSPSGINVLRDSPHDHLHHHGLMFAVRVNGVNFWEETETSGRQMNEGIEGDNATLSQRLRWVSQEGETLLHEHRMLALLGDATLDATVLTWQSQFKAAPPEGAVITGAHYHGLGMRFVAEMDASPQFLYSSDAPRETVRGSETTGPGAWCAIHGTAEGKPVTVAMFDDPQNPHPVSWFTMTTAFAYMSATLEYHKNEYALGELSLRYGVAVWDGHVPPEQITAVHEKWVAHVSTQQ